MASGKGGRIPGREKSICKGTRHSRACWENSKCFRIDGPESVLVRDLREMWLEVREEPDHQEPFVSCKEISTIP